MHTPATMFREVVRVTLATWYRHLTTVLPRVGKGWVLPMDGSGLGSRLPPDIAAREGAIVRTFGA